MTIQSSEAIQAKRSKALAELDSVRSKMRAAVTRDDLAQLQRLVIDESALAAMAQILEAELAPARRRELTDEIKRLQSELDDTFAAGMAARKACDAHWSRHNERWPFKPGERSPELQAWSASTVEGQELERQCEVVGSRIDATRARIDSARSELEALK